MHWLNHMLEFTTSFAFFAFVLHVDERFVLKKKDSEVKKCIA